MNEILDIFARMTPWQAGFWMLVENFSLFAVALVLGELLIRVFRDRRIGPTPDPTTRQEVAIAVSGVVMNSVVTLIGWYLWRAGYIVVRRDVGLRAWLDALVLLAIMDLAMYVSHRIAHVPIIYRLVHETHHKFDRPRPIDLFVLNPIEVLGFGGLWLAVICVYSSSWLGMLIYLTFNLLFGMMGHLGVEPFPESWERHWLLRYLGTSTFHARHYHNGRGNFGFYTLIWDRLFGTVHTEPRSE